MQLSNLATSPKAHVSDMLRNPSLERHNPFPLHPRCGPWQAQTPVPKSEGETPPERDNPKSESETLPERNNPKPQSGNALPLRPAVVSARLNHPSKNPNARRFRNQITPDPKAGRRYHCVPLWSVADSISHPQNRRRDAS